MCLDLRELEGARDLLRVALQTDETYFEPGHPTIALDQPNLALVLRDLGELAEACDLMRVALATCQQHLQPNHPTISTVQTNLSVILQYLGKLEEAQDLAWQAYQILLQNSGIQDSHTQTTKKIGEGIRLQLAERDHG